MADPYKDKVVLYLPFEGATDNDPVIKDKTGKPVTTSGIDVLLKKTPSPPFGTTSCCFDTTTGIPYLSVPHSEHFDFSKCDWTIEGWFYFTNAATQQVVLSKGANWGSGGGLIVYIYDPNTISLSFGPDGSWLFELKVDIPGSNTWMHIAFVRHNSSNFYIFVNGILKGSTSNANIGTAASNYNFVLGQDRDYNAARNTFYVKDFRITNGVARYTGNFSVSQTTTVDDADWANVVLAVHGEGTGTTFTDVSNSAKTITTYGNTTHSTSVAPPFGTSSIYFDGSGDYLRLDYSSDWDLSTVDFTIEGWVYPTRTLGTLESLVIKQATGGTNILQIRTEASGKLSLLIGTGAGTLKTVTSNSVIARNTWTHFAICRYNGVANIFVGGVSDASGDANAANGSADSRKLYIGAFSADDSTISDYFLGYIKDLRITKGVARYTQNFNPWRVADPYYKDTVLLLTGEGSGTTFVDQSPINNTVTLYYDTTHSTTVTPPFGSSSIYFDGTQDWLSVPKSNAFNFGTNDFTVEMWVYLTQYPGTSYIRSIWSTGKTSGPDYYSTRISVSDTYKLYATFSTNGTTQTTLADTENFPLNTWVHVALARYNGNITLYKNGAVVTYSSISGSIYYSTEDPVAIAQDPSFGGAGYDNRWKGYMKNIVVTNGSARYKGIFTPKLYTTLNRLNGVPIAFPDKTTIKTIIKPFNWDESEPPRIVI